MALNQITSHFFHCSGFTNGMQDELKDQIRGMLGDQTD